MRTTITLADDVAAAVEKRRRRLGVGVCEAVNELARAGLTVGRAAEPFHQTTHDLGVGGLDFSNVAEAVERLDGPTSRECS